MSTRNPDQRHETLVGSLSRVAYGRRLETGLALAATAARVTLSHLCGAHLAEIVLALCAAALLCHEPSRSWLVKKSIRQSQERWFGKRMASSGLFAAGTMPGLLDIRTSREGWVFDVAVVPQLTADDLSKRAERIAVAFGARAARVVRYPNHAGRADIVVSYTDPLANETVWPWAGLGPFDLWEPILLGYREDGEAVMLSLAEHHLLIGGEPGAGKSNALSMMVACAAGDPNVELWLFDGKLVELAQWKSSARRFVGADVLQATTVLNELRGVMEARYQILLDRQLRKVTRDLGFGLVVVVIDELALYLQGPRAQRDAFGDALRDVVARGRAAGIVVVAATQKPSVDVVPSSIRDLFSYRLALRCATKEASDTVLGSGWGAAGYSASDIDGSTRGVGWLLAEGTVPRRMRCFHLDDEGLSSSVLAAQTVRSQVSRG